jgi:hypothetical protein
MKRITTGIVVTLAALSFAAAGCSKDKDKEKGAAATGKTTDGKPADKVAEQGGASTGYAVFPADSEFVLSFSLEGLRKSPMWAQIAPMVQAKLDSEMKEIKEACGFDPVGKLASVYMGGKSKDEKSMVVVVKGFNKSEMETCGAAMAKKEGKEFTMVEEDGLTHMKSDGKDVYMAWLDSTTAMVSPNPDKAWVKARAAGQGGLDTNAAFMDLLKGVDSTATIWFAAMPSAGSDMDMSKNVPGAKGGFGSIKVVDGLAFDLGMRFDTPENAKNAQNMATAGLQQAKGMMPPPMQGLVDKTAISTTANDVLVKLTLTTADLEAITAALGPMLGGMMGGMAK